MSARARASQSGFSLVELLVASAVLTVLILVSIEVLATGSDVHAENLARQNAVRLAGTTLEAMVRELSDADPATIVWSAAQPDEIQFQRVIALTDETGAVSTRLQYTDPITFRQVPTPHTTGMYAVERVEGAAPGHFLGGHVALLDANDSALPGLVFEVTTSGAHTKIGIALTVVISHTGGTPTRTRLDTTIHLDRD